MATTTTNYGFNIAEGSDAVNLLTQCYPNFTSLDSILLPIQQNGTTPATHTKVGTVHQLVRTTTSCAVLRFVATGNYTAGDTFTVDGASVTATTVGGTTLPTGAFVINQSVLAILNGSVLTVLAGGVSSVDAEDVAYDNTVSGLTATDVQDAIDELKADIPTSMASSAVTYDNTGSGLTATNVQDAIDEVASGSGGAEHGIFELWVNPTPDSDWTSTDVITFTTDKQLDSIIIAVEASNRATNYCTSVWNEFEVSRMNNVPMMIMSRLFISNALHDYRRSITSVTKAGNTYTIAFGDAMNDATTAVHNDFVIPMRVLGLVHNS